MPTNEKTGSGDPISDAAVQEQIMDSDDGSSAEAISDSEDDSSESISSASIYRDVPSLLVKHDVRRKVAPTPFIQNSSELLANDKKGLATLMTAMEFAQHLCIGKSDVAPDAGNGLYLVATEGDLILKKGHVITWFNGRVAFYDKDDETQLALQRYTVPLGSSLRHASFVILADPHDYRLEGCGQFANHSLNPNAELGYVQGRLGVVGVTLVLIKNRTIRQGQALEIVFDYGLSSQTIHQIPNDSGYSPRPKSIAHLRDVKAPDAMRSEVSVKRRKSNTSDDVPVSISAKKQSFFSDTRDQESATQDKPHAIRRSLKHLKK